MNDASIAYAQAITEATRDGSIDIDLLFEELSARATSAYRRTTAGERDLVEVTPSSFTYLFDATPPNGDAPDLVWPRLVAGWGGRSGDVAMRDKTFLRGFPLPTTPFAVDRGHLIARAAGGDEGIGINLVPQMAELNRGHSLEGRWWRRLERLVAADPEASVFVRALYDDPSDVPACFDYLVVQGDGVVHLEQFTNRPAVP